MTVGEQHEPQIHPHLSIGEVLEQLRDEFPDVTISKIRFLESQGLIDPERTPSGYRKFSDRDLERLRWILLQQREHFLPLRVIKERLDAAGHDGVLDFAAITDPLPPRVTTPPLPFDEVIARADEDADHDGEELGTLDATPETVDGELTRGELLEASGLTDAQLDALEDHGLLAPVVGAGERALYGDDALEVASLAATFHARGIEARHLKMYRHFAEREAALFAQVLLVFQRQRTPAARTRLVEELEELTRSGRRLRSLMLRQALRDELGG